MMYKFDPFISDQSANELVNELVNEPINRSRLEVCSDDFKFVQWCATNLREQHRLKLEWGREGDSNSRVRICSPPHGRYVTPTLLR